MTKTKTEVSNTEEVQALRIALARAQEELAAAKARKEHEPSRYFCHEETGERIKWGNLSETKKFFETNHPALLGKFVERKGGLLTSKEFHQALAENIGL